MATLANIQGGSLVPDLSQALNIAFQIGGTPETRAAEEAEVARQAGIQKQLEIIATPGAKPTAVQAAFTRLGGLDPEIARVTQETFESGDERAKDVLRAEVEKGAKLAKLISDQPDFASQQKLLTQFGQEAIARGESPDRIIELQNMNKDRLGLELMRMKIAAQDIETILTPQGGEQKSVQSSKILPGGVVQVVFKDGSIETLEGTPEEIAVIKSAEDRGTSLAAERARLKSEGVVTGKGEAGRVQKTIAEGVDAVQGIPILRRSLQLLERIETGGIDAARLRAKQLFGVEGADEGELSANLGRAVLSQLKATFGSAFTEREGARLERMSAGFGKSAAANKRILRQSLKIADNAAQRALDAARDSGDTAAEEQILDFLDGRFDLTDEGLSGIFTPVEELTDEQLLEQLGQ